MVDRYIFKKCELNLHERIIQVLFKFRDRILTNANKMYASKNL